MILNTTCFCGYLFRFNTDHPGHCPACGTPVRHNAKPVEQLDETALSLIQSAPENPLVRGLVLAQAGLWLPDELKTGQAIMDWIRKQAPAEPEPVKQAAPAVPEPTIQIEAPYTEWESGSCNYTCQNHGTARATLTREQINRIAGECDSLDEFEQALQETISEKASEHKAELDFDNRDYTGYDPDEDDSPTDFELQYNFTAILEQAKSMLTQENRDELLPTRPPMIDDIF